MVELRTIDLSIYENARSANHVLDMLCVLSDSRINQSRGRNDKRAANVCSTAPSTHFRITPKQISLTSSLAQTSNDPEESQSSPCMAYENITNNIRFSVARLSFPTLLRYVFIPRSFESFINQQTTYQLLYADLIQVKAVVLYIYSPPSRGV